jgi:hypothetical protein
MHAATFLFVVIHNERFAVKRIGSYRSRKTLVDCVESMIASKEIVADRQRIMERTGSKKKNDCRHQRQDDQPVVSFD